MQSRNASFGSYSGLHVSDDGRSLIAIGWGSWFVGRPVHGPIGALSGMEMEGVYPIRDVGGQPITNDAEKDAESLVEMDGSYYVGFETNTRIALFRAIDAAAVPVNLAPEDLASVPNCCGFSSVLFTARGELLAVTEAAHDSAGNVRGWLWQNGGPQAIALRGESRWLPVDIALLPDGDLLLVEVREDLWTERWHSRFSRVAAADVQPGRVMSARVLGELYSADHPDRIEGIHARRGRGGETLVYAMSDSRRGWPSSLLLFELEAR
ncbi:MAG: esterase-like activity of phytase family protein [Gemmatimonadota bacterium]